LAYNKKILIITYYWPPSGGPAVQRWLSLANELAQLGWEVFVITVDEKYATYQLHDDSHTKKIHENIKIIKTKTREPFGLYKFFFGRKSIPAPGFSNESNPSPMKKIARFIRGNLFIPDPRRGWKPFIVKAASELIIQEQINKVITAGPPHSTHLAGIELKKKFAKLEWTCDFHDLWTDVIYYHLLYHLPATKRKDAELEKKVLEQCDSVLTVGEKYKARLLSKSGKISAEKFHVCRIGYDENLFRDLQSSPQEKFIITYTGTMADYYQPGIFFKALKNVLVSHPQIPFQLRFVGIIAENIQKDLVLMGLAHILDITGYVLHEKAVSYTKSSIVLLLVNPVTKDEEVVIPGKIYEYLAARKPIINITKKESETAELVEQCHAGKTFSRNMQKELEEYLSELAKAWAQNKTLDLPYNNSIERFSRRQIALELNNFLLHERPVFF
jgi:glycosyltransferase involved in cell wall biosynthesis